MMLEWPTRGLVVALRKSSDVRFCWNKPSAVAVAIPASWRSELEFGGGDSRGNRPSSNSVISTSDHREDHVDVAACGIRPAMWRRKTTSPRPRQLPPPSKRSLHPDVRAASGSPRS